MKEEVPDSRHFPFRIVGHGWNGSFFDNYKCKPLESDNVLLKTPHLLDHINLPIIRNNALSSLKGSISLVLKRNT